MQIHPDNLLALHKLLKILSFLGKSLSLCYAIGLNMDRKNQMIKFVFKFAELNIVILDKYSYFSFVYNSSKTNTENSHLCSVPILKGMLRN